MLNKPLSGIVVEQTFECFAVEEKTPDNLGLGEVEGGRVRGGGRGGNGALLAACQRVKVISQEILEVKRWGGGGGAVYWRLRGASLHTRMWDRGKEAKYLEMLGMKQGKSGRLQAEAKYCEACSCSNTKRGNGNPQTHERN